jgi:hypothetical protein
MMPVERAAASEPARQQHRSAQHIGGICRESPCEHALLIACAQVLKERLRRKQSKSAPRQIGDQGAEERDLLGEIQWMPDDRIRPTGDRLARLGHEAVRAAEVHHRVYGRQVAQRGEHRRHVVHGRRQVHPDGQQHHQIDEPGSNQRGQSRLDAGCLGHGTRAAHDQGHFDQ